MNYKNKIKAFASIVTICTLVLGGNVYAANVWDGLNEAYTKPTIGQQKAAEEKSKLADEYLKQKIEKAKKNSADVGITATGGSKTNRVGTYRQSKGYTCGPASARNLIRGYNLANGGSTPSEDTLIAALGTKSDGTGFDATKWQNTLNQYASGNNYTLQQGTSSGWNNSVRAKVIYTIDKTNNYNVIADLYHGSTSTPVNPVYASGAKHYICVYGYNDSTQKYNIVDSYSQAPLQYQTSYTNLANSTQQRGIVW